MKFNDVAKETTKTLKMLYDMREIDELFAQFHAGYGFDRIQAQTIIQKHNKADPIIGAYNNNPRTTIPLLRMNNYIIICT